MPSAEIIAIGTELLLGEIQDTNTRYLARSLRDIGLNLYRATLIGDNQNRIADAIREALSRADIVITTGGLGPTVDDPTRQAVALAFGVELEFHPELWEEIQERFSRYGRAATPNNRRQAYLPAGAVAISNPVGTAPSFYIQHEQKSLISLPGVPKEMEYLLSSDVIPYLKRFYDLNGVIKARVLHTVGVGESFVDEKVGDLEALENPTVGLLAHPGQTDIRITARAESLEKAEEMIDGLTQDIFSRLGDSIYGIDNERLESVVHQLLVKHNLELRISHSGFDPHFFNALTPELFPAIHLDGREPCEPLPAMETSLPHDGILHCTACLKKGSLKTFLSIQLESVQFKEKIERGFGSAPENATLWAENTILDVIRRKLLQLQSGESTNKG